MKPISEFSIKALQLIKSIPKGKVATYGQIAILAGNHHGARQIAWLLHSCTKVNDLPWQRVINSKGKISFPPDSHSYCRQKSLLMSEGIIFGGDDQIDLEKYQWR